MAFKRKRKIDSSYSDPESLFRDRRNRQVQGLLAHQSDILRRYQEEAFDKENVALELPTGSGKTLVGLLIAEFRRVTKNERVLYLCPNKQLVLQVCEQSKRKYGIDVTPFIGKIKNFDPGDKQKYLTGQTIAVATYSALFNTNPFFNSPQLIILDDAHASENYIASNWSLNIERKNNEDTYMGLLQIIADSLPTVQRQRFFADEPDQDGVRWVEKVPTKKLISSQSEIYAFLNENTKDSNLRYPWSLLKEHIEAAQIYCSYESILIRPVIPPSMTHRPFAGATQRVYMSATLGLGGDLERITGVRSFHRLPIPKGWDKQGIGRRYFMFPEISLKTEKINPLLKDLVKQTGRALILVPSDRSAEVYQDLFDEIPIYSARDIENSKDDFISEDSAIAVLANRYDGIDLLDDQCRLLIIEGLPKIGNLQEHFFTSRMAAGNLFSDRIRTRIIQSFGRCTRSATDYAAVCVIGEDFFDWLILPEKRSLFHPELQGELSFGAEQSKDVDENNFLENLEIFLEQSEDWAEVDSDIREIRDNAEQLPIPGEEKLLAAAKIEVEYQYAMWDKDYEKGLEKAEKVSSILSGNDLKGLRGFWYYLAASASEQAAIEFGESAFSKKAADLYKRASSCIPSAYWLRVLAATATRKSTSDSETFDVHLDSNIERMDMIFEHRSYALPNKFEKDAKRIMDGLNSDDSNTFEEAHRQLGELLGFEAFNSSGHATPDPWWISDGSLCLVAEDKSDSNEEHSVPVKHTRQAASHAKWIKANATIKENAEIYTVMITPATKIHEDIPTFADDVGYWHLEEFIVWARNAISVVRKIRNAYTGPGQVEWRVLAEKVLMENKLDPKSIIETATRKLLKDVEIE